MDTLEIADIGWFARDDLPSRTQPTVQKIFDIYDTWRENRYKSAFFCFFNGYID